MIDQATLSKWADAARRDDWYVYFVGSDVRQMLGEIERLRAALELAAGILGDMIERGHVITGQPDSACGYYIGDDVMPMIVAALAKAEGSASRTEDALSEHGETSPQPSR